MKLKVWIERNSSTQVERYDVGSGTEAKLQEIINDIRIQLRQISSGRPKSSLINTHNVDSLPVYLRLGNRYMVSLKGLRSICFDLIPEGMGEFCGRTKDHT